MKTPISYYWWKQMMLKHILPLIPEHKIYIEPYFWWGAVFRAKKPAECEVINDVNMNVINFYEVLKTQYEALHHKIEQTLLSRETYKKALLIYESPWLFADSPITRARSFYIVANQGFANKIGSRGYDRSNKTAVSFQNKIGSFQKEMSDRLRHTQIEQNHAHRVIESRDDETAFIYADPPYINSCQGHYGWYTEEHFVCDLNVLANIKGRFLLSNYPSEILAGFIKKHNRYTKTFDKPLTAGNRLKAGQGKRKKEILVANYPI